jgi:NTE family protein
MQKTDTVSKPHCTPEIPTDKPQVHEGSVWQANKKIPIITVVILVLSLLRPFMPSCAAILPAFFQRNATMAITIPVSTSDAIPAPIPRTSRAATGLVLQGGGALGAFELGAIECLLDSGIKPDVVSGVSIGAINAAVLCGHRGNDAKASLHNLWQDLTTLSLPWQSDAVNRNMSAFGCPGMYRLRTDYWDFTRWTSFYDTIPLINTLEKHIDFNKLNPDGGAPRLIMTATNIFTGKLEHFDSKAMQITPSHVRASGSLPPGFEATRACAPPRSGGTEHVYWDGGLFDNTPLSMVIDALQEIEESARRLYVISLFPGAAVSAPENMNDVFARMTTLAFSHKMASDMKRANKTTEMIKFTIELDKLIEARKDDPDLQRLKDLPGYKVLKGFDAPIDIIEITNTSASGASDFSAAGIERRRESGYQATAARLAEESES